MLPAHFNRRQFLHRSSLIAMAPTVPAFLSRTARATEPNHDGRILVVIHNSVAVTMASTQSFRSPMKATRSIATNYGSAQTD